MANFRGILWRSLFIIAVIYPGILFFLNYPMGGQQWELQDPVVSEWVMLPALRTLRFEIFHHFNFWWSNLRANGMPLMGNEIQGAPMFPLSLLWIWVPEPYYWNFLAISRLLLIAIGCFYLARQTLKLKSPGDYVFVLCFGFGLFPMRWMNHPWMNGYLTGIWYLWWLGRCFDASETFRNSRFLTLFGVLVTYCIITCGFPEASVLIAFLALCLFLPKLLMAPFAGVFRWSWGSLILGHLFGLLLSLPQTAAILDLVNHAPGGFRGGIGVFQFTDWGRVFFPILTRITDGPPQGVMTIHYWNLIPLFLFLYGLFLQLRRRISLIELGVLLSGIFFLLKAFKGWDAFNLWIGQLPVLSGTWFTLYLFPMLMFPFAYYAARGAMDLVEDVHSDRWKQSFRVVAAALVFLYLGCAIGSCHDLKFIRLVKVTAFFLIFIGLIRYRERLSFFKMIIPLLLLVEIISVRPDRFISYSDKEALHRFLPEDKEMVQENLKALGVDRVNYRDTYQGGERTTAGNATLDVGAPAILTNRTTNLRMALFNFVGEGFGGMLPLSKEKVSYGYEVQAAGIHFEGNKAHFDPDTVSRAFLPSSCVVAKDIDDSLSLISNSEKFQLGSAILEAAHTPVCPTREKWEKVSILKDRGARILLSPVKGPAVVVLSDNWYSGWIAKDARSGEELQIVPANYEFRAAILPENREYQIEWEYAPIWMKPVLAVWFASLLLFFGYLLLPRVVLRLKIPTLKPVPHETAEA